MTKLKWLKWCCKNWWAWPILSQLIPFWLMLCHHFNNYGYPTLKASELQHASQHVCAYKPFQPFFPPLSTTRMLSFISLEPHTFTTHLQKAHYCVPSNIWPCYSSTIGLQLLCLSMCWHDSNDIPIYSPFFAWWWPWVCWVCFPFVPQQSSPFCALQCFQWWPWIWFPSHPHTSQFLAWCLFRFTSATELWAWFTPAMDQWTWFSSTLPPRVYCSFSCKIDASWMDISPGSQQYFDSYLIKIFAKLSMNRDDLWFLWQPHSTGFSSSMSKQQRAWWLDTVCWLMSI